MSEREYIKKIQIESYDELVKIIQGKTDYCEDLREKFIFRGLEDDAYELIPSALRKGSNLDNFVDEDFKLTLSLTHEKAVECGFTNKENYYEDVKHYTVDKFKHELSLDYNFDKLTANIKLFDVIHGKISLCDNISDLEFENEELIKLVMGIKDNEPYCNVYSDHIELKNKFDNN